MNLITYRQGRNLGHKARLCLTLAGLVLLLLLAQAQISHAQTLNNPKLQEATILPDAVLTLAPTSLTLTFTQPISPTASKLEVKDATGKVISKDLKISGNTASVSLDALADGKYSVSFVSISASVAALQVAGEYSFTLSKTGTATKGDLTKLVQREARVITAPSGGAPTAGLGGNSSDNNSPVLIVIALLGLIGLASGSLALNRKAR